MAVSEQISRRLKDIQHSRSSDVIAHLVTKERSQKLDLLVHLITNLKQSLIITGPKGVGKTSLLKVFQAKTNTLWPVIFITVTEQLSFETVQRHLIKEITHAEVKNSVDHLNTLLRGLEKLNRRVVLVCDDAGKMFPGLMTILMQYADNFPCLRVVFALSDEEITQKRVADPSLDLCHFIEIPAFSESQTGEFYRHLSDGSEVSDALTEMTLLNNGGDEYKQINSEKTPTLLGKGAAAFAPGIVKPVLIGTGCLLVLAFVSVKLLSSSTDSVDATLSPPGQAPAPLTRLDQSPQQPSTSMQPAIAVEPQADKGDVYRGYGRAQQGDALDEFDSNNKAEMLQPAISEQVKVEIMPSESEDSSEIPESVSNVGLDENGAVQNTADGAVENSDATENTKHRRSALKAGDKAVLASGKSAKSTVTALKKASGRTAKAELTRKTSVVLGTLQPHAVTVISEDEADFLKAKINDDLLVKSDHKVTNSESIEPPERIKKSTVIIAKPTLDAKPKDNGHADIVDKFKQASVKASKYLETLEAAETTAPSDNSASSHYTLQVMSFSQQALMEKFMAKHRGLGSTLRVIKSGQPGNEKYVVVYGSFSSAAAVNNAKKKLPAEFKQGFARKM